MHKLWPSLFAAIMLLASVGTAAAQRIDNTQGLSTGTGYIGDEPNTPNAGKLPHDWHNDPSARYPADANGFPAPAGGGLVLSVEFVHRACVYTVTCADGFGATSFLGRIAGADTIVPGLGQFWAMHGTFDDVNKDGWISDGNRPADRLHTSVKQDCGGEQGLGVVSTNDPNGLGKPQGADTKTSLRCARADEWVAAPATKIAAYVTPGYYTYYADSVNWERINNTQAPDFYFQGPAGQEGHNTGRYWGPNSNFDYVMLDNSLLETTVIEAITNPVTVLAGKRTDEAGPNSLVEVDVFDSVDPAVETLYETVIVGPLWNLVGCDVEFVDLANACPTAQQRLEDGVIDPILDPILGPIINGVPKADPTVGPVNARHSPPFPREQLATDYSTPHLYLDARLVSGSSVSLARSHSTGTLDSNPTLGDGERRPYGQMEFIALLGIWTDANGDGIIGKWQDDKRDWVTGEPVADDGCPDVNDCGNTADPNSYTFVGSEGEYQPVCGAKETGAGKNAVGSFLLTVTSSTNSWGLGAYVLTDRRDATNSNNDALRDDGRVPFNPYDDVVLDIRDDNDVDSIVTAGPITIHMLCAGATAGTYRGYERVVILGGTTNLGFDVTISGETGGDFQAQGVPVGERVRDSDTYAAFNP